MDQLAIFGGRPALERPIGYGRQYIDDDDIQAVVDVLKSDYLTCGPKIAEAEEKLCRVTGAKHAVLIANGTAALHAACFAAGVGPGDEVITTPLTFAASANCALYCGARPVFADIDPDTYNIDPACVERLITDQTKAVVAVDFTGQAVELDRLRAAHNSAEGRTRIERTAKELKQAERETGNCRTAAEAASREASGLKGREEARRQELQQENRWQVERQKKQERNAAERFPGGSES